MATLNQKFQEATTTSSKLAILATYLLTAGKFDMRYAETCIIGHGLQLAGFPLFDNGGKRALFRDVYGVSFNDSRNLFLAYFGDLEIGKKEPDSLDSITREQASEVVALVAQRYAKAGK